MKFEALVEASEKIRSTTKKKEKVSVIAHLLQRLRGREAYLEDLARSHL